MKVITIILAFLFVQPSMAVGASLQEALSAAIDQAENDHAQSKVSIQLEREDRVASWHQSEQKVVAIEATSLVDINDDGGAIAEVAPKAPIEKAITGEESLKEELSDI